MKGSPRYVTVLVYAIAAITCLGVAGVVTSTWWIGFVSTLGIVFGFSAAYNLVVHWDYNHTENQIRLVHARNEHANVLALRALGQLSDVQIQAYRDNLPMIHIIDAEPEPLRTFDLGGDSVNWSFLLRFLLEDSSEYSLAAVGSYSEGTKERRWAQLLTRWLIGRGWASPAAGPYEAQWAGGGRELALRYFGVER